VLQVASITRIYWDARSIKYKIQEFIMISTYILWYVKPNPRAVPALITPRFIHINTLYVPNVFQCTVRYFNACSKGISSTQLELLFRELKTELHKRQYKRVKSISECSSKLGSGIYMYHVIIGIIHFTSHSLTRKIQMTFCHTSLQNVTCELDSKTLLLRVTQTYEYLAKWALFGPFQKF
jgi:hypothetical protein